MLFALATASPMPVSATSRECTRVERIDVRGPYFEAKPYVAASASALARVDAMGRITTIYVLHSSGDLALDRKVLAAARERPLSKPPCDVGGTYVFVYDPNLATPIQGGGP